MKEIEINGEKYFCDFEKDIISDINGIEVDEETRKFVIEMIEEVQKQAKEQVADNIRQQNDIQLQNEKEINDKEDSKWLKRFKCCYESNFEYINYVGEILTYKGNEYVVESQTTGNEGVINISFDIDGIPRLFDVEKMVLNNEIVFKDKRMRNNILWNRYINNVRIYFVKQTVSYTLEREGKFLWGPEWESYYPMSCLKPGDITINYYNDNIVSICVITEITTKDWFPDREGLGKLPNNFLWVQVAKNSPGYFVKNVKYYNVRKPISPSSFDDNIIIKNAVFNDVGYIYGLNLKEFYSFCCEAEKKEENKESVNQAIGYSFKLFRDNLEKDKNK